MRALRASSKTLSTMDRFGGAVIGGLKGVVLIYFIAIVVTMLQVPLKKHDPDNALRMRDGYATSFVTKHNIVAPWQYPDLKALHAALRVGHRAAQESKQGVLREHARAADLLRRDAMKELLKDPDIVAAAQGDNFAITLADDRVRALLNDEDFVTHLRAVDWDALAAATDREQAR